MASLPEGRSEEGLRLLAYCPVSSDWLQERVSAEEAEALHVHDGKPFGDLSREWNFLKSSMLDGDQLWNFSSPPSLGDKCWASRSRTCAGRQAADRNHDNDELIAAARGGEEGKWSRNLRILPEDKTEIGS